MSAMQKYPLPDCLRGIRGLSEESFRHWLDRKAQAHFSRDKKRGRTPKSRADYKERIYAAVRESNGRDFYTGRELDWHLLSKWSNAEAQDGCAAYRRTFWELPSVDHDGNRFRICSWRMNDAKNDQTIDQFLQLAESVRKHRKERAS